MKPTRPLRSLSRPARRPPGGGPSPRPRDRLLLSEASWSRLATSLLPQGAGEAEVQEMRAAAENLLRALRRAAGGDNFGALPHGRAWLADGTWVRFWSAYVSQLDARGKRAWIRALERTGAGLSRSSGSGRDAKQRRAWWLVSLAVLQRELQVGS